MDVENGLKNYINFWDNVFNSEDPLNACRESDGGLYDELNEKHQLIDSHLYPEPYYGYLAEDISKDLIVLLHNPGAGDLTVENMNAFTKERYLKWDKNKYQEECGYRDKDYYQIQGDCCSCHLRTIHSSVGCGWRRIRWHQAKFQIGLDFDFMHTMEIAPYHTKDFRGQLQMIIESKPVESLYNAVRDIATHHKVRYLFAIGSGWNSLFEHFNVQSSETITSNTSNGKVYVYRVTPDALPILVYPSLGGGMNLPANKELLYGIRRVYELPSDYTPPRKRPCKKK